MYCRRLLTFEVGPFELSIAESEPSNRVFIVSLVVDAEVGLFCNKVDSNSSYIDEYIMVLNSFE